MPSSASAICQALSSLTESSGVRRMEMRFYKAIMRHCKVNNNPTDDEGWTRVGKKNEAISEKLKERPGQPSASNLLVEDLHVNVEGGDKDQGTESGKPSDDQAECQVIETTSKGGAKTLVHDASSVQGDDQDLSDPDCLNPASPTFKGCFVCSWVAVVLGFSNGAVCLSVMLQVLCICYSCNGLEVLLLSSSCCYLGVVLLAFWFMLWSFSICPMLLGRSAISSQNRFSVMQSIGTEDDFKSPEDPKQKSDRSVIEEGLGILDILEVLLQDKSMDVKLSKLFRSEKKSLEGEIELYSICPDFLLPEKIAVIEARIRKIKGLVGSAPAIDETKEGRIPKLCLSSVSLVNNEVKASGVLSNEVRAEVASLQTMENIPQTGSEGEYVGESSCDGSEGELEEETASGEDEEESSGVSGEDLATKLGEGKEGKERDDVNHGRAEKDVAVPHSLDLT
ncbi:hypothetical protein U1Q18_032647 [Sarracenia purpurea var. burkii]